MNYEVKNFEYVEELDKYFNEVKKYNKRLTREEEIELGIRIKRGDKEALDKMVKHNLRFVVKIAKKYRSKTTVSFADLISEGNIGLIKAAKKYDPQKKIKFSSYAVWWIKASINECIERYNGKVNCCLIDDSLTDVRENYYDSINEDFEKNVSLIQGRKTAVEDLIKCLEEREKRIIMLFYGLGNYERGLNLEEISKEMHLTKERVRQIKDNALVKMKCEALCSDEFDAFKELR